jgi:hypothetical protein
MQVRVSRSQLAAHIRSLLAAHIPAGRLHAGTLFCGQKVFVSTFTFSSMPLARRCRRNTCTNSECCKTREDIKSVQTHRPLGAELSHCVLGHIHVVKHALQLRCELVTALGLPRDCVCV